MLAIVGASGKLGFATLTALLDNNLLRPNEIVCTTSSEAGAKKLQPFQGRGVQVNSANWDDQQSFVDALQGCTKLFLISSSRISKDFNDAPPGEGREADHFVALEAAKKAGVKHVCYTSLAFAKPSLSRVMKAHERTEDWLQNQSDLDWTIIREGLYNESWPLYFGHYGMKDDDRTEVPVAGDCKISWTAIGDLGLANALILTAPKEDWKGRTCYLSQKKAHTLEEVAGMVSKARAKEVRSRIVSREQHEKYYVEARGMDEAFIKWWSKTYDALNHNECGINDSTLERLLKSRGRQPKQMETTIQAMFE